MAKFRKRGFKSRKRSFKKRVRSYRVSRGGVRM